MKTKIIIAIMIILAVTTIYIGLCHAGTLPPKQQPTVDQQTQYDQEVSALIDAQNEPQQQPVQQDDEGNCPNCPR